MLTRRAFFGAVAAGAGAAVLPEQKVSVPLANDPRAPIVYVSPPPDPKLVAEFRRQLDALGGSRIITLSPDAESFEYVRVG